MKNLQDRLVEKSADFRARAVTYVAFGDSITHGGMEDGIHEHVLLYHNLLKRKIETRYPTTLINVINSGVGGDTAVQALPRLERDVLMYDPDFVTIMFGTNDAHGGREGLPAFIEAMERIVSEVRERTKACILLITPPMLGKADNPLIPDIYRGEFMLRFFETELQGYTRLYVDALHRISRSHGIPILDIYEMWAGMEREGIDVHLRLSNGLNHPDREFHAEMAVAIDKILFQEV